MKALVHSMQQTPVEVAARPVWGLASGGEFGGDNFGLNFAPSQRTRTIRHSARNHKPTTAERLFDATAGAKIWAASVAMRLDRSTRDRLFRQLDEIHDEDEWYEGDSPIALESFKSFVRAIIAGVISGKPGLSLTPQGNIIAIWSGEDSRLSIEFQPHNLARFLWRQNVDGDVERLAGTTAITRLPALLGHIAVRGPLFGS